MAYWFGFAALAGAFGGLIAFGIQHIHSSMSDWRFLFIVEGSPTIVLGILTMFFLPDRPETTPFFNEKERAIALDRANRSTSADIGFTVNISHVWAAFKDWRIYDAAVIYFGANAALASISAFLPTIIKSFGYSNALAQLLTVPPYAVAAVVLVATSWVSDRLQSRGVFVSGAAIVGAIGYLYVYRNSSLLNRFSIVFLGYY
jgi:MFS family permease